METGGLQTHSGRDIAGENPSNPAASPDGRDHVITDPSGTIVFDVSSGISLEEQQEILAGINAMASGNRLVPEAAVTKAKKRGFLFPLFVNIGGLIILGLGFALLYFLNGQDEQSIRAGSATLGLTERKLIQEIRQETNRQISEKENEINDILSKLSAADAEYRGLEASVESLTEEQQERAASLLRMQEEYHGILSGLQEERTKILEDSRLMESTLRTQAEERARELSSRIEQSQATLSEAMEELRLLTNEQERAARVEAQMGGYYATVNNQITAGHLDEAAFTLQAMKGFLNAPSLQGVHSLDAGKQTHLVAIAALEGVLAEARRLKEVSASLDSAPAQTAVPEPEAVPEQTAAIEEALTAVQTRNVELEQKIADQQRTIAAFSSQDSEQGKIIADFESTINELRTENNKLSAANASQQNRLNQRDSEVLTLRAERDASEQQVSELNSNQTSLRSQVQAANDRVQESETALDEQKKENASLVQRNNELQREINDLRDRGEALRRLLEE